MTQTQWIRKGTIRWRTDKPRRWSGGEPKFSYPRLDRQKKHTIEVVIDRLIPSYSDKSRLFESVQSALKVGNGVVVASTENKDKLYSQRNACVRLRHQPR